jgi:hypothetical protein
MTRKIYPYQNLSLENIKGEKWEAIPGLDGYYLISNFGRIKRLEYEMQYRNGAIYVKPEKIIKPMIVRQRNRYKKDYTHFLTTRVKVNGKRYSFTIARIVYYCFVASFNLQDQSIFILCKDLDNFNIRTSNLVMATLSEKQQRVVSRKRMRSPFLDMTTKDRQRQRQAIVIKISKEVSQYSLKGRKIKTYPSAAAAQRATGIFATSIGNVASGGKISAGGFLWRWGREQQVDVNALKAERRKIYNEKYGQKVTQYDLSGKKIAHYLSIKEAAEASGAHVNAINLVLRGKYKSAKGFYWKKGYGKDQIDLSSYKWGKESMALTRSKKVKQYDLEGKYLQTFISVKQAAQSIGVTTSTMSGVLNGRQQTCSGYKWQFG